ncbi:MAG: hypothetical protein ACK4YQ_03685 [Phenylobacterium sp.]|uniref:hypothetical protein n=1 Tax=Phenylobacterium sp. TaxID=1871053 RepID=UPI00391B9461
MTDELEHQLAALELLTRELIAITDPDRLAVLASQISRGIRETDDMDEAVARGRALSILDCALITDDDSLEIPLPPAREVHLRRRRLRAMLR